MKRSCSYSVAGAALMLALAGGTTYAAADAPAGYVSKEDYEKVLQRLDKVEAELAKVKTDQGAAQKEHDQEMEEFGAQIKVAVEKASESHTGDTKFLVAGDFSTGFTAQRHNNTTFDAGFAPLFLWEFNKQLLFEGALDVSFNSDGSTQTNLALADITYSVNDYLNVSGGLFAVPFGQYHNQFDPPWINKLPDDPLVFSDGGLAPGSMVGIHLSGAVPIRSSKLTYDFYAVNGVALNTTSPTNAGDIDYGVTNGGDNNNNKTIGGRIGFLPIPELEMGVSVLCGQASDSSFPTHVNVHEEAVDLNYTKQIEAINGTFSARAEWIWSQVDRATYTPIDPSTGDPLAPINFNNNRSGGYLTLAYRPTMVSNKILRNLEFVARYDRIDVPSEAPAGRTEQRYTLGVDYWLDPRVVIKTAYEFDILHPGPGSDAFMVQFGVGF